MLASRSFLANLRWLISWLGEFLISEPLDVYNVLMHLYEPFELLRPCCCGLRHGSLKQENGMVQRD